MEIIQQQLQNLISWIKSIETKIETINERTKIHTLDIKRLEKIMKEKQNDNAN